MLDGGFAFQSRKPEPPLPITATGRLLQVGREAVFVLGHVFCQLRHAAPDLCDPPGPQPVAGGRHGCCSTREAVVLGGWSFFARTTPARRVPELSVDFGLFAAPSRTVASQCVLCSIEALGRPFEGLSCTLDRLIDRAQQVRRGVTEMACALFESRLFGIERCFTTVGGAVPLVGGAVPLVPIVSADWPRDLAHGGLV